MSNGSYLYQFLSCVASPTGKSAIPPIAPQMQGCNIKKVLFIIHRLMGKMFFHILVEVKRT